MTPQDYRRRATEAEARAQAIEDRAMQECRDMTEAESTDHAAAIEAAQRDIASAERVEAREAAQAQRAQTQARETGRIDTGESETDKLWSTGGFRGIGHFNYSVMRAKTSPHEATYTEPLTRWRQTYARVQNAMKWDADQSRSVSAGTTLPGEGGDLIPPGFSTLLWDKAIGNSALLSRINFLPTTSNTYYLPQVVENSRVSGSRHGGLRAYWAKEAATLTATAMETAKAQMALHKVSLLVRVSEELMEDALLFGATIEKYAPMELAYTLQDSIVNGAGGDRPLGVLSAPCKVAVAKESGQAAASIVAANISKMYARMPADLRQTAVWIHNQDIEPALDSMYYATGSNSGQLVYLPPGGLTTPVLGTLKGRPLIPIEQCPTLGTEGDLALVDPGSIYGIAKAYPTTLDGTSARMKYAVSMHAYFLTDEVAMKYVARVDAQPAWATPLTPAKGSNTLSPIVTLAVRA